MNIDIAQLEAERKKALTKCIITFLIAIITPVVFFIIIPGFITIIGIISLIIGGFIITSTSNKFKTKFKNEIMPIAASTILKEVTFSSNGGIPSSVIEFTNSMSTGDVYRSSNLISGKYKDVGVSMCDLNIQDRTEDSDGHTSYTTIFQGQWLIFDFNKNFKANVQVWEKNLLGGISRNIFHVLKKVELEDIDFNKKFKVLSQNELESFYIMTPNMMEKIKEVEKEVSGVLLLVFIDSKLHVGIKNGKTSFNVSLFTPINLEDFTRKCLRDLNAIIKFIDILDLDNDLFISRPNSLKEKVSTTPIVEQTTTPILEEQKIIQPSVQSNNGLDNNVDAVEYLNNLNNQ